MFLALWKENQIGAEEARSVLVQEHLTDCLFPAGIVLGTMVGEDKYGRIPTLQGELTDILTDNYNSV